MSDRLRRAALALGALAGLAVGVTCSDGSGDGSEPGSGAGKANEPPPLPELPVDDPAPATARWATVEEFRADLAAERHPSDGGGSARLVTEDGGPLRVPVRLPRTFTLEYTAGPDGIAAGGALYFLPEPYWGWTPPQVHVPRRLGYTTFATDAEGVELLPESLPGMARCVLAGRGLHAGETITIVYGEGSGAQPDRHADRAARLWVAVDGDGDGVRGVLEDSPTVEVVAGPPARLALHVPGVVRPGEVARLHVAVLDDLMNAGVSFTSTVHLEQVPGDWDLPAEIEFAPEDGGVRVLEFHPTPTPGRQLVARARLGEAGEEQRVLSNPMVVDDTWPRIRWADLHGHSGLSDGTGTPEDFHRYARDVAGLDVVALTDHDHFGVRFLDAHPDLWAGIGETVRDFHEPGRFVTLHAYEWTSWIHGHRHVLSFDDALELRSSLDPRYETPRQLWDALRGRPALTFAHHTAGEPVATNWSFRPDPVLEPLVEVTSVHGSSEAADAAVVVRGARRGGFVRDQLERGLRLGFVGSGDGHDGHPGLAHLSPVYGWARGRFGAELLGQGGLAAITCEELTREALLEALRARRTYATSGPRILLRASLAGHPPGADVSAAAAAGATLFLEVIGTGRIARVDVVRSGRVTPREVDVDRILFADWPLGEEPLRAGEYVYLRVVQEDGGVALTSPWFVRE